MTIVAIEAGTVVIAVSGFLLILGLRKAALRALAVGVVLVGSGSALDRESASPQEQPSVAAR